MHHLTRLVMCNGVTVYVNQTLDSSAYSRQKLACSSLCKCE